MNLWEPDFFGTENKEWTMNREHKYCNLNCTRFECFVIYFTIIWLLVNGRLPKQRGFYFYSSELSRFRRYCYDYCLVAWPHFVIESTEIINIYLFHWIRCFGCSMHWTISQHVVHWKIPTQTHYFIPCFRLFRLYVLSAAKRQNLFVSIVCVRRTVHRFDWIVSAVRQLLTQSRRI